METEVAVEAVELRKEYLIGARQESYRTIREALTEAATAPFRSMTRRLTRAGRHVDPANRIWALKDVSFDVRRGEVFGVIGHNGAGKSTLLKLLCRITEPSAGYADVRGRVGALLEVGTGFHPELTGRENVYLNGAILGMTRADVAANFDDIVEFAEVTRFIDTPVKRYSSGMQLRLAFSVAAHIQPDVLLADEVLAVGDAAFQRKCLGKMNEAAGEGRTVVFVSHNMTAVRSLCSRAMLLDHGTVKMIGEAGRVVDHYLAGIHLQDVMDVDTTLLPRPASVSETSEMRISHVTVTSAAESDVLTTGRPMSVRLDFTCDGPVRNVSWGFYIETIEGLRLLDLKSAPVIGPLDVGEPGTYSITGTLDENPLSPGRYRLGVGVRDEARGLDWIPNVLEFVVEEATRYGSTWFEQAEGVVRARSTWAPPERVDR